MSQFGKYITPRQKHVNRDNFNEITAHIRGNQSQPRQNENAPRDYDQVKVENGSGYNQDPFAVLRIHDATWDERSDQSFINEGMRNGVESLGVKPSDEWNQVAVLQKSAPEDWFQQGVCSGPTPVFVLFPSEDSLDYPYAIPIPDDSSKLLASPYGLNRILWHEDVEIEGCDPKILQCYVNMGEDGQWVWWKLKEDLTCCGSATAKLCDECGTILQPDCPIERTIYAPKSFDVCECEGECKGYKAGDVIPAWWYQYLEKWITIPNYHPNFQKKEQEVVTGLEITGGRIVPGQEYETVVTDVVLNLDALQLSETENVAVSCTGNIVLGNDALATAETGDIKVSGTAQVNIPVVSACSGGDSIVISDASLTSSSNLTLSGTMQTTATVNVPIDALSLDVSGTCSGTASGPISVSGSMVVAGPLVLTGTLPTATVTGTVTIQDTLTVTGSATLTGQSLPLTGGSPKTFSRVTSHTPSDLSLTSALSFNIPENTGTISGTLSNATTTPVSTSGVTATIDLSSIFEEVDAVDPDSLSFTGCTLSWDTMRVLKLKAGASLSNISVSLSGSINIPSTVTGTSASAWQSPHTPFYGVMSFTRGSMTYTDDTVTVPTSATLSTQNLNVTGNATINNTYNVTGTAEFESPVTFPGASIQAGSVTLSGNASLPVSGSIDGTASGAGGTATGTAVVSAPVTVSGPLNISEGVAITGTLTNSCPHYAQGTITLSDLSNTAPIYLTASGSVYDQRTCTVPVPTGVSAVEGYEPIEIETERIVVPTVDLTGATIQTQTTTLKYINCECDEEDSEDSSSEGDENA